MLTKDNLTKNTKLTEAMRLNTSTFVELGLIQDKLSMTSKNDVIAHLLFFYNDFGRTLELLNRSNENTSKTMELLNDTIRLLNETIKDSISLRQENTKDKIQGENSRQ